MERKTTGVQRTREKRNQSKAPNLDEDFHNKLNAKACFLIDGYKVNLVNKLIENKLTKLFYINGYLKGEYCDEESEENKRFAYSYKKFRHYPAFRKLLKKNNDKRFGDPDEKIERRVLYTSVKFKTIIQQWCDREINKSIVLVDDAGNEIFKYK